MACHVDRRETSFKTLGMCSESCIAMICTYCSCVQFIIVELDKFKKIPETCTTDLDKLIYTMKAAPTIKEKENLPDFMADEWLASALKELEYGRLSPDERANLEIAIAHEMFNRSAVDLMAKYKMQEGLEKSMEIGVEKGMEKGMEINLKSNILQIITKQPEWTDPFISDLLQAPLELVKSVRASMKA
jgi:hypothetical protein